MPAEKVEILLVKVDNCVNPYVLDMAWVEANMKSDLVDLIKAHPMLPLNWKDKKENV